ncbi:GPCR family 2 secretin-like [Trinorchestia longiramus]|nr:GPCR family 2 secretin-like [Trinorchestia longiramus]
MGGYALTVNGCEPANTSVTIVDGSRYSPMSVESSLLQGSRHEVECMVGKAAVSLPRHSFALLPGGYLIVIPLGMYFTHDHYCMEHVQIQPSEIITNLPSNKHDVQNDVAQNNINDRKKNLDDEKKSIEDIQWRAKVCLKHPVKICNWSQKGLLDFTKSTSNFQNNSEVENRSGDVSASLGEDTITWNYSDLPLSFLTCTSGSSMEKKAINSNNYLSYSRGGVVFSWNIKDNLYINFKHDQFCIDKGSLNSGEYVASFCRQETRVKKNNSPFQHSWLQRKCCPSFQIFNVAVHSCQGSMADESWIQKVYNSKNSSAAQTSSSEKKPGIVDEESKKQILFEPQVVWGFPECSWQSTKYDANDFRFKQHEGLAVNDTAIDWPHFCFETFRDENSTPALIQSVAYCLQPRDEDNSLAWDDMLTMSLMGVSCVFMTLTLMTYLCVPGVTDRITGGCVVSEVVSLLVSFLLVIVAYLPHGLHGSIPCIIIGTIGHAVTLASFFWLNIICFDVYSTIRGTAVENRRFDTRRYLAYCCWGWGAPCLIATVGAVADSSPSQMGLYRPHTAQACFPSRYDSMSQWLYVYGPIAVLLTVNVGLFVHLSYTIIRTTRQAMAMAKINCDVECAATFRMRYKSRMLAYGKLFLVMGLSWITEVFSFQFNSPWVWIVTDSFNALRGVFIFFIFVYKPEIWNKVKQTASQKWLALRHRCSCSLGRKTSTTTAPTTGTSTHTSDSASLSMLSSHLTSRVRRAAKAHNPNA